MEELKKIPVIPLMEIPIHLPGENVQEIILSFFCPIEQREKTLMSHKLTSPHPDQLNIRVKLIKPPL